jgi:polyphosphate kinase
MLLLDNIVDSKLFLDREISWLEFNQRILEEAANIYLPVLERVKFLSIAASNLNEFISIRYPRVKLYDSSLYLEILAKTKQLVMERSKIGRNIKKELLESDILILSREKLLSQDRIWLKQFFLKHIYDNLLIKELTRANLENTPNSQFITAIKYRVVSGVKNVILYLESRNFLNFIRLEPRGSESYIKIEDVILECFSIIFPDSQILEISNMYFVRNSLIDFPQINSDNYLVYYNYLEQREKSNIICILTDNEKSGLVENISKILKLQEEEIFEIQELFVGTDLNELYQIDRADLKYPGFAPKIVKIDNILQYLQEKDLILHHPYQSFDSVVQFLFEAAFDPAVISINQTIYRTNYNSQIMSALIEAAKQGKDVTVILELKARFSEQINLYWAEKLIKHNIKVIFTKSNIKAHLKLSMIEKKIGNQIKAFVHFATGNYNPKTAKSYSDLSYFTTKDEITSEIKKILNWLKYQIEPGQLNNLICAPVSMRENIIDLIKTEMFLSSQGRKAFIIMKLNALVDQEVINWLYKASMQGVTIKLIVRGICCLRPGIEGLSENITVKSIVSRFLEHARIFFFSNGQAAESPESKLFIASADIMERNFDERIEAMLLISEKDVKKTIYEILEINLKDEKQSWELIQDQYVRRGRANDFSAQDYFTKADYK